MTQTNKEFQRLLKGILHFGNKINTRNSETLRTRNEMVTFYEAPLVSVRRTAWKSALREFEWFLSGSSDVNDLHESVKKWWEPWADGMGEIKNNYGKQFKRFGIETERFKELHEGKFNGLFDQITYLKQSIKDHPFSRRAVITTWNTADMAHPETKITNCHGSIIQAFVEPDNTLHLTMYQRSSDMVLGLPHNWIQYWAFLQYLAHHGNREVGTFTWIGGDCHIYDNHIEMANRIVDADIKELPKIDLIYKPTSEEFLADDFTLSEKYEPLIKESLEMTV